MKILTIIFVFLFIPIGVSAHLSGDALTDGDYRIEIGSFPEVPVVNEPVHFSLVLDDLNGNPVNNASLWLRVAFGNEILFSSSDLLTSDGIIDLEYVFQEPGEYELTFRFIDIRTGGEATVKKNVQVEQNTQELATAAENKRSNFNLAILTFVLGMLGGIILARSKSSPLSDKSKNT